MQWRTGSLILPARLDDARNFPFKGERTEAETAYAKLAKERARTTAELAAVVLARLELRFSRVFDAFCSGCHVVCSLSLVQGLWTLVDLSLCSNAEGHSKALQQSAGTVVILRRRDDGDVHALEFVDLGVVDLSEDQLIAQAKSVVAAAIEALR